MIRPIKFALLSLLLAPAMAVAQENHPATATGPITIDGHTLDPAIQKMLADSAAASDEENDGDDGDDGGDSGDPGATAEGRKGIRDMVANVWAAGTAEPPEMQSVKNYEVTYDDVTVPVRVYRPRASGILPIIVYYHGGGWFVGGVEASDKSSRQIAEDAQAIVVSVEYRLSPEAPYPGAWDDAEKAYEWVVAEATRLGGAPDRVCVGGDSAGGNMAIVVTTRQMEQGESVPLCQILYYPAVDNRPIDTMRATYNSSRLYGQGFNLDREFTDYILPIVFPGENLAQPEISPLFAEAREMPPTLIATAGFDPLRDSQRAYVAWMMQKGNNVTYREFPTLIHGFLQHTALTPAAVRASRETARAAGAIAREAMAARGE